MRSGANLVSLSLAWVLVCSAEVRPAEPANSASLPPQARLTLASDAVGKFLGPLFSYEKRPAETLWSLAPLLSYHDDSATDFTEFDFVYPFLTYDRFGLDSRLQVLQLLSFGRTAGTEGETRSRLTLFPIVFHQRSSNPAATYTAVVPFLGHLQNRLFRDEVRFFLFPLYVHSRKRDLVTDNYLFPIFHSRHGEKLKGWQAWPLMGVETKGVTSSTNSSDEAEIIGGHEKFFLLWPFYFQNTLGIGTQNPQTQHVFLPFYSVQRSPLRDSSTYLWPFGFTRTEDREKKYREWGAPWPFVIFARGEGKTANRIWPLFGQAKNPILQSDFYLWPLYKYNRATS